MISARRWHTNSAVVFRHLSGGGMLYDESGGQVHHLNQTAVHVWEACQHGATFAELVARLCDTYQVPREVAMIDVEALVEQLHDAGALR